MFLLHTYLAAEIMAPLLASFLLLNAVLFLGRMVPFLDMLIDFNIDAADFIRLCSFLAPQLLAFSIPMAAMMGVIIGLTRLANDGEIMALKSCGTGVYRMLAPVIVIGLAATLLAGFFTTRLMPAGNVAMERLLIKLAKEKFDRGLRERHFSDALGSVVLYADQINKENGQWQGVYVTDLRDAGRPVIILAKEGWLAAEPRKLSLTLVLLDGSLHRVDGDTTQNISFGRYSVALSLPAGGSGPAAAPGKKSLNLKQLQEQAANLAPASPARTELLIEYHRRLALPAGCLILAVLGLPLALLAAPGQRAIGMPLGLLLFLLYFISTSAAAAASENLVLTPGVAMWLPNAAFGLFAIFLVRAVAREKTAGWLERAAHIWHQLLPELRKWRRPGAP